MQTIGFVGPSGTGKSHHALVVAYDRKIEAIIDDGLLIYRNRIVAGHSAKDDSNRMKAVRTAIFSEKADAQVMRRALARIETEKLLVLGTSKHMIERICDALNLPFPEEYIRIEEVSTPEDMAIAKEQRTKEGRHIIPVPTMELKTEFEHSVVRPVFSYYGKLIFSDKVLLTLVRHTVKEETGIVKLNKLRIRKHKEEETNGLSVDMALTVRYGENLKSLTSRLQKAVEKEISYTTGMTVEVLKITVRDVAVES